MLGRGKPYVGLSYLSTDVYWTEFSLLCLSIQAGDQRCVVPDDHKANLCRGKLPLRVLHLGALGQQFAVVLRRTLFLRLTCGLRCPL